MPCGVTVLSSPIFSPSTGISSIFFISPASCPSPSPSTSPVSSPTSTLTLQTENQADEFGENSGSALKRMRPTRIDIPTSALGFGVDSPKGVERVEVVEVEGDGYSVYCKRGRRGAMEDRYSAFVDVHGGDSKQAFFGVFDGHGGAKAAEFAANNLDRNIMAEVSGRCEEDIEKAIKNGYLITDKEFLKEDVRGGTCCVTALVHKGNLVVSNAGDCRAVMSRGGIAEALTSDHRPLRTDERDRIETSGGYVDCCNGVWRIQGSLAVSRAIGDQHLKQWVISEPETKILRINPDFEFLILASDGVWDKVTNQEAVDVVRPLCRGVDKPDPFSACKKLAELSARRGSIDDISAMIILLGHFVS